MCGIFTLINNSKTYNKEIVNEAFEKGKNRGPDNSSITIINNITLGFHRLAINGLNSISNQPIWIDNIGLICNGEIYNFGELTAMINITPNTNSDCEIIIHLYKKFGIEYTLSLLDGYFSFIIYDMSNINEEPIIYIARDPYGVRPLYILHSLNTTINDSETNSDKYKYIDDNIIAFSSDLKVLNDLLNVEQNKKLVYKQQNNNICNYEKNNNSTDIREMIIEHYPPGTYSKLIKDTKINSFYNFDIFAKKYSELPFYDNKNILSNYTSEKELESCYNLLYYSLKDAVEKRVIGTTDRPIACLLSGGLDSSLITALVSNCYDKQLETYSIGMPGGEDLKYARMVAQHIGSKHTEIIISEDDFFNAIPEVIRTIESYDTTTIRASVGNYLVSKYISKNSDAKVIFNGDGSDELTGGYLYFHFAPDALAFDCEVKRLIKDIYLFDVLRSDKSISSNGLEPRTPFLDRAWVQTYLSIPLKYRYTPDKIEKWLLRKSIEVMNPSLLPYEVLWRTKEAFSDGVSNQSKSWFEIITERTNQMDFITSHKNDVISHLPPKTNEQKYYRTIFDNLYPNCSNIIPYFWMPKFIDATDASARTLPIYNKNK